MSAPVELSSLDLAALLCSKVCHDLINPVAAIKNGFQLVDMDQKPESREEAYKLIRHSAESATAKLEFARIAFGAAGSAGAQIDVGDVADLTRGVFEPGIKVNFNIPKTLLAKNRVKLLMNLVIIAGAMIPRGGTMTIDPVGSGEKMGFTIRVEGSKVVVHPAVEPLIAGTPAEAVTAQTVQPFYAGVLARAEGMKATLAADSAGAMLSAQ